MAAVAIGDALTTIRFDSTAAGAQTNVPVTFGQVFTPGHLPAAGAAVQLKAPDNSIIPCQINVKRTNSDGSVRHAIISAIIPSLGASASVTYSIVRAASGATGTAAVPSDFAGLNATAVIVDNGTDVTGPNAGTTYTADASDLLASGTYQTWLSGPVASEWIVRAPLKTAGGVEHPDLHARFNILAYKGQAKARVRYIIENNWAKEAVTPANTSPWENVSTTVRIYAAELKAGTTTVHARAVKGYTRTRLTFNSNGVYNGNATGLPNNATVYTATITADGVAKAISIIGSAAQNFGNLKTLLNAQLEGAAFCVDDEGMLGLRFESATTGPGSSVVISYGTLFPALGHVTIYRPIRGDEVVHYPGTRWKKTFWWGAAPSVHIAHNKSYLIETKAIPNYSPELTGSPTAIATNLATMLANEDIGQNGMTKALMGDTGYAPGIGILPEWTALYLVSQNIDAKYVMLKQADLQGSWPVHVRDYSTDMPISFDDWPFATFSPTAGDSRNAATGLNEKLPVYSIPAHIPANRNSPDTAHHPDFCFVPYMVTGDHYYMEGLLFYHRFLNLSTNAHPTYRDGRKCLWRNNQVRGQGWTLRTSAHAQYITPDDHPLHSDMAYSMAQNVIWYQDNYVNPTGIYHNNFGFITHGTSIAYTVQGAANTGAAPWMDDFVTAACGRAVELGYAEFAPLLTFKAKCVAGRMTSGTEFCWQMGASYSMRLRDTASSPIYTTWGQVYQGSYVTAITSQECGSVGLSNALTAEYGYTIPQNGMTGYASTIGSFPSNLQPAAAYCATFGMTGGEDAWTVLDARAQKPDYNLGPQFAIVPRTLIATDPDPIPEPQPTGITMAIADHVKDLTTTTGTGAFALANTPPLNHVAFLTSPITVGAAVPYSVNHLTLNEWENGVGTLTSALTLARTTVTSSSNGGAPVNFSAGTKEVACVLHADMINKFARLDSTSTNLLGDLNITTVLIEESGVAKRIAVADFIAAVGVAPVDLPVAGALVGADVVTVVQGGVEKRTTLTAIAAAVAQINGGTPPSDATAPTLLSAAVSNATPNQIVLTFSETLANFTPPTTAFAVSGTVSNVARSGATITLTVTPAYAYNDTINVTYTNTGSNPLQDAAGNQVASFGPVAVTNGIAAPGDVTAPTASSAAVANATPTVVGITMSELMDTGFVPAASAFTVGGHTVSSVAVGPNAINLTVSAAFVNGEAARTAAYTQPGTNQARDAAGNLLASFSGLAITNNVAASGTVYTITPNSASSVPATSVPASARTTDYTTSLRFNATVIAASGAWNISPTPTSARSGWGTSSTTPPAEITSSQNLNGASSINGLQPMTNPSSWVNAATLLTPPGASGPWFFWIKPLDGVAQCVNAGAPLMITA